MSDTITTKGLELAERAELFLGKNEEFLGVTAIMLGVQNGGPVCEGSETIVLTQSREGSNAPKTPVHWVGKKSLGDMGNFLMLARA